MQLTKPAMALGGFATVTLGGFIGNALATHDAGGVWVFLGLVANLLFQVYRERRHRRWVREEEERQQQRESRIQSSMRTRLSDLSARLDKIVREEIDNPHRRSEDFLD